MRSGLLTLEHMLIPIGLRRSGASSENAIAEYGVLHGMAFPVVFYPQFLLQSISGLLVPEVAEEAARGNEKRIENIAHKILHITLIFSVGTAGLMICFSEMLGNSLYQNKEAGIFIKAVAPLIPVMYLDSAVDGLLKGLGEQLYSMRVNILDSTMSVIMVWLLLPHFGVWGYVLTVYVCEVVNGVLSLCRLLSVTKPRISVIRSLLVPLLCTILSCSAVTYLLKPALSSFGNTFEMIVCIILSAVIYLFLLFISGCLTESGEIKSSESVKKIFGKDRKADSRSSKFEKYKEKA